MMKVTTIHELDSFAKAAKDPRWLEAMNKEIQSLGKNNTWDLVPSSPHKKGNWIPVDIQGEP